MTWTYGKSVAAEVSGLLINLTRIGGLIQTRSGIRTELCPKQQLKQCARTHTRLPRTCFTSMSRNSHSLRVSNSCSRQRSKDLMMRLLRNLYSLALPASSVAGRTFLDGFRRSDPIFALPTETEREVFKSASGFSRTSETIRKSCALLTSTRRRQEGLCVRVDGRERRGLKPVL
jgi:hypothetical protein